METHGATVLPGAGRPSGPPSGVERASDGLPSNPRTRRRQQPRRGRLAPTVALRLRLGDGGRGRPGQVLGGEQEEAAAQEVGARDGHGHDVPQGAARAVAGGEACHSRAARAGRIEDAASGGGGARKRLRRGGARALSPSNGWPRSLPRPFPPSAGLRSPQTPVPPPPAPIAVTASTG